MLTTLIEDAVSVAGRRVTLTKDCNEYPGARPYLTATYWRQEKDGRTPKPAMQLYTPFWARGRAFFAGMLKDETDPARLTQGAPICDPTSALPPGQATMTRISALGHPEAPEEPQAPRKPCRRHRLRAWVLACPDCNPETMPDPGALPKNWRAVRAGVLKRDGRQCKHCGSREQLSVNHIVARPVGNHDPRNLVTLCDPCHDAVEMPAVVGNV